MVRINGCAQPPTVHQAAGIGIVLFSSFIVYSMPVRYDARNVAAIVVYSVTLALLWVSGTITTLVDPSDPAVKRVLKEGTVHPCANRPSKVCTLCKVRVEVASKHCTKCNRCTADFDHHCKWLNNCIGRGNYRWFLVLTTVVEVISILHIYFGACAVYELFNANEKAVVKATQRYERVGLAYFLISAMVIVAVAFIPIGLSVGYLLGFHVALNLRRQSTYAFILAHRKERLKIFPQIRSVPKMPIKSQSIVADISILDKTSTVVLEYEERPDSQLNKSQSGEVNADCKEEFKTNHS